MIEELTIEKVNLILRALGDLKIMYTIRKELQVNLNGLRIINVQNVYLLLRYKYQIKFIESNIELLELGSLMPYFDEIDEFDSFGLSNKLYFEEELLDEVINYISKYNISIEKIKNDRLIYTITNKEISYFISKYEKNLEMMKLLFKSMKGLIFYMPRYVSNVLNCEVCSIGNGDKCIKIIVKIDKLKTKSEKHNEYIQNKEIPTFIEIYEFSKRLEFEYQQE